MAHTVLKSFHENGLPFIWELFCINAPVFGTGHQVYFQISHLEGGREDSNPGPSTLIKHLRATASTATMIASNFAKVTLNQTIASMQSQRSNLLTISGIVSSTLTTD